MALPEPLRRYLRLQRQYDERIMKILEEAALDIQRRVEKLKVSTRFSDSVRASQLRLALSQIRRTQLEMFLSIGDEIRAGQLAAAIFATDDLEKLARIGLSSLPRAAATEFVDSLMASAEAGINTFYSRVKRELSTRLYKNGQWSTDHIETLIRNGILRNASARELAKDVYRFVSPTAPGGASYVAMRLARTEINNAFHNQQIKGFQFPWVESVKWNLSGSHPRKDECNTLAESDQYNLGPGQFPRGKVPGKPHPQCLCFLTATSVSPRKFADDVRSGKYDDELRRRFDANLARLKGQPEPVKKTTAKKAAPTPKKTTKAPKKTAPPPAPKEIPVPKNAQPYHTSIKGIEDLANTVEKSAIKSVQTLTGGVSADTELITFANGMKVVRKSAGNPGAEHAASIIGRSIGIRTPRVYRNHPGEVHMDYITNAKTAVELDVTSQRQSVEAHRAWRERRNQVVASDDGKLMGLFDVLIRNRDRSIGNWMLSNDNRLFAIDHGHSGPLMMGSRVAPSPLAGGPFAETLFTQGWKGHPFSTADLAEIRRRIEAVGDELIHAGQRNALDYALGVLDKMSGTATSTRNLIAGGS